MYQSFVLFILLFLSTSVTLEGMAVQDQTGSRPDPNLQAHALAMLAGPPNEVSSTADLQRQGTVTGLVTGAESGQPIATAQVMIPELDVGVITNAQGRYELSNVPAGSHTVQVQVIGYQTATSTVTVVAGETVELDFQLNRQALALDELVVVGYTTQTRRSIAGSVASVSAAEISERQVVTLQDALRGRVAGVNVRNSGVPGVSAVVDIRGRAFTEDNDPLYVVDGMYLTELRNLNPNDIESIQVLKDASAASQYGARAANGVVVITTRQGASGDGNRVSMRSSYGYQEINRLIPMMNAREWAELTVMKYEQARVLDPTGPTVPQGAFDVLNGVNTIDTDWQRAITRGGHIFDNTLSVSGGSPSGDATYFISGGYTNHQGPIIATDFERLTLRVNSQLQRGRFTVGENLTLTRSDRSVPTTPEQGQLGEALRMLPAIPVFNTDGQFGNDQYGHGTANYPTFASNPVGGSVLNDLQQQQNEMFGTLFGEVSLLPGVAYRLQAGVRYNDNRTDQFNRWGVIRQNTGPFPASLSLNTNLTTGLLLENLVSLNRTFGPHGVNAVVGYTQERTNSNSISASRQEFADENLRVLPGGTDVINNNQNKTESRMNSYLGRVSYTLADRYVTELSFRRDGSSRFGPENRWGNFWAASLGWVMSDEAFFQDLPLIGGADFFRLRGSYGTQGNQDFDDYQWQANIASNNQSYILGPGQGSVVSGLIATDLSNPLIRWQDNTMQNYGVDMSVLDNRLSFTAEYYTSESGGLLAQVPLVPSVGSASNPFVNAGAIRNSGFEFSVQHAFSRPNFDLNTGINLSTMSNKVLSLGTLDEDIIAGAARTAVGLPMGHFWLYHTCGIFQTQAEADAATAQPNAGPGDQCWVDHNNDGLINDQDRHYAGSPWPSLEGGFFFDGRVRQVSFRVGFRGSFGSKAYNAIRPAIESMTGDNNSPVWLEPWTPENQSNTTPRALYGGVGADNTRTPSTRYLEDNSYLKVQNIQLGYDVPANFLERAGIRVQEARMYVNFQDIHTFTDYLGWDPEFRGGTLTPGVDGGGQTGRYPNPRTITVGFDLGL